MIARAHGWYRSYVVGLWSMLYLCTYPWFLVGRAGAQEGKPYYQNASYGVWADRVVEGAYTAEAISRTKIVSNYPMRVNSASEERTWELRDDLSAYPSFHSPSVLADAAYNLSLSELVHDIAKTGTFDAGASWPGVWTRDTSYSILLALAAIAPREAKASLLRKVKRGRIIQDTGTGGSWPVSSDRVCWALAAWEVYLVTGDRQWLRQSEAIVEDSIRDDEQVVIDPATSLAHGESSFMDWREQTYPRWMQPADISSSEDIGTNALFFRVYKILGLMNHELGRPDAEWNEKAERMGAAINAHLFLEQKGLYGQYLYGRVYQTLSPRTDALGDALAVLFDVPAPEQQARTVQAQPLMAFGVPTVYPETPGIVPYHNDSVWPFVQAFWNLAAAKEDNQAALLYGLASIDRSTALFLTNKENFVADSGSPVGTAVNSDRQLWSVAGSLAMVYRVFFGMEFAPDGLHLHPTIPEPMKGTYALTNFHYRGTVLSMTVRGFGHRIRRVTMDGEAIRPVISSTLVGDHAITIDLDNDDASSSPVQILPYKLAPDTPKLLLSQNGKLTWNQISGATGYDIYRNGVRIAITAQPDYMATARGSYNEYQVAARDSSEDRSFLSNPVTISSESSVFPVTDSTGSDPAKAYVVLDQTGNTGVKLTGVVPSTGRYSVAFRYANGSGPINTDKKCAIRTLFIDGKNIGPVVMPQRGMILWDDWGISTIQIAQLSQGPHSFELRLLPEDLNMDGAANRAFVAFLLLSSLD